MLLEPIINTHKIKYNILRNLIDESMPDIKNSNCSNINIYINLDSILKRFYGADIRSAILSLSGYDRTVMCSELVNISAHYRKFFWSRYHTKTTFYFYYMNKKPKDNIDKYENYFSSLLHKKSNKTSEYLEVNNTIKDNMKLFTILSLYIPKVYLALSDGIEPALIPYHFINKSEEDDINLVLSKDPYDYQLVSKKNTYILRLKYDSSFIIDRTNLFNILLEKTKYKPNNNIDGRYYEKILPLISSKSRDIKSIKGHGLVALIKKLDKYFDEIAPDMSFNLLMHTLDIEVDEEVTTRYKIVNLKYQYKRLSKLEKMRIEEFVEDRYENRTIMQINSDYFKYNPIQLIELCDGIEYY